MRRSRPTKDAIAKPLFGPRIGFVAGLSRAERVNTRTAFIVFGLCLVAGHAGGLGIAPLAAIAGLIGWLSYIWQTRSFQFQPTMWILALFTFLFWATLTSFWSPYPPKGLSNPVKLIIGVSTFLGAVTALRRAGQAAPNTAIKLILALGAFAVFILFLDAVTGYRLSFLIDPVNVGEDPTSRLGDAEMNVGHGITVLNLLLPSVFTLALWTHKKGHWLCLVLFILLVLAALAGKLMVGVLALAFSSLVMLLAYKYGVSIIRGLTLLAIGLVGFAPLWGSLLGLLSQSIRDSLPFSWEHRVVTWSYVAEKTREAPLFGHGFDTARTIQDTFSARGHDGIAIVSLHPHNAGLHIWLETGAIGALFAVITLWFLGKSAERFSAGGTARRVALAGTFSAAILISSVSYGVWQDWWWASLAVTTGLLHWIPKTRKN